MTVSTTGDDIDEDGYTVTLGNRSLATPVSGSVTFESVAAGSYEVQLTGLAENCTVQGDANRTVAVTETRGAQVAFVVECTGGPAIIACPGLSLERASGAPLDRISIGILPPEMGGDAWGSVMGEEDGAVALAFVAAGGDEGSTLLVPLHPSGALEGGEATIQFTDGDRACAPVAIDILALPPSPDALPEALSDAEALLATQAEILGVTLEDLHVEDISEVPYAAIPIALAWSIVANDDPVASLRALIDELDPETRAVVSALLGRVDLGAPGGAATAARGPLASTDPLGCSAKDIGTNPVELDRCMLAGENMTGVLPEDVESRLQLLNTSLDVAMLANKIDRETAAAILGAVRDAYEWAWTSYNFFLPHDLELTVVPEPTRSMWEDALSAARWEKANLSAKIGGQEKVLSLESDDEDARRLWTLATTDGFRGTEAQATYGDRALSRLVDAVREEDGVARFAEETVGPIDVTDPMWSTFERLEGTSVRTISHQEYKAVEYGPTTLQVRTADGKFGEEPTRYPFVVQVRETKVALRPSVVALEPGDVFDFTVEVEAENPDSIRVSAAEGQIELRLDARPRIARYTAPSSPGGYSDQLWIDHLLSGATWGAVALFAELDMEVSATCLAPGASTGVALMLDHDWEGTAFEDAAAALEAGEMIWEIEGGGGIDGGGTLGSEWTFTAPSQPAVVTLRAKAKEAPNLDAETTIRVGDCGATLALYRYLGTELDFPFSAGECGNGEDPLWEDDTLPASELDPLVPPDPSVLLIGRTDARESTLEDTQLRGSNLGSGCEDGSFFARAGLNARFTGSQVADRIDVDITTEAESNCVEFDFGTECSSGTAVAATIIRFDRQISQAVNYRLRMVMTCSDYLPPGAPEPEIRIVIIRAEPDGTLVNPPGDRGGFSLPCGSTNPLASVDHPMEASAPAEEGQVDVLFIMIQFTHFTTTFEGHLGPGSGSVQGYITLTEGS